MCQPPSNGIPNRIIAPADAARDDVFDEPGVELGDRHQPQSQQRETL